MAAPPRPDQIPHDRLSGARDESEYFDIADDPDEVEIVETDSMSAFADLAGQRKESAPPDEGFYGNIAKHLPKVDQDTICTDLMRLIDIDKEARKKRDEQYEEGIKRTGMGNDAPGGAAFKGASRVVHPVLTEACVDYQSRIIREVWPPQGPVKPGLIGAVTKTKTEKAKRVAEHLNFQITHQIKGARATMEVLFAQVPLGGSQYIRQYWDHTLCQPCWQFASIDHVLVPFNSADFASAKRKTFIDTVDSVEFRRRVSKQQYLDLELAPSSGIPEMTKAQVASQKVEGLEDPGMNLDNDRELYETMCFLEVTQEMHDAACECGGEAIEQVGEMVPYLITMDVVSRKMLSMYRAWERGDPAYEPIEHLFEFGFIPWRGAYSIGFPQLIGGLSAAATGALRGLLDAAHVNNIPSALALKGSGLGGQTRIPDPGEIAEIDAGSETDDVRKRVMPMPFNPPSQVLFALLGFLVDAAKGVVRTSMDETSPQSTNPQTPVGTQISRVEEGLVNYTAVHGRAHAGMDRLIRGLYRLNRLYLPEEVKVDAGGMEIMVSRADYEGPCDVQPTSDPSIYSELQRFNQLAYIQQRQMAMPQLYKAYEVELAGLRLIKWPDPESLLNVVPEPKEMNAVNECLAVVLMQPIAVWPDQDHLAHLQVHLDFIKSPVFGGNPLMGPTVLPPLLKHSMEHIAYVYARHTEQTVQAAAGMPIECLAGDEPEVKQSFDQLLAQASQTVVPELQQLLANVLPVLTAAMQQVKASQPPPPMDPSLAAVQAAQAETQRKTADDQAGHQLAGQKLQVDSGLAGQKQQSDADLAAQKLALEQQTVQIEQDRVNATREATQAQAATKLQTTQMDNETAQQISSDRLAGGGGGGLKNGESLTGR